MIGLVLATPVVLVFGYYGARKLVYAYEYCGSYGKLDGELGWTLGVDASSCLSLRNHLSGTVYFDSKIFTNAWGFRDAETGREPRPRQMAAIGDSWTFGYGVDHEESYPYFLSEMIPGAVSNMAIPGYSAAQALLLLERNLERLRPRVVVYLSKGLWSRSKCVSASRPNRVLAPCFWWDSANERLELMRPAEGFVFEQAKRHIYPGGYLTAGYEKWQYMFVIKPLHILRKTAGRLSRAVAGGPDTETATFETGEMFREILSRYARLMREHDFAFLLADPRGAYRPYLREVEEKYGVRFAYLGPDEWQEQIEKPARDLPEDMVFVPKDGHYAAGMNRVIAAAIYDKLAQEGRLPSH
jgi:hypothetical protein